MEKEEIRQCLEELNDELRAMNVKGEVCLYGGAVMCLVFDARPSTKDVDAIFEPVRYIRRAAGRIAERRGLDKDWLNYAVKMFVVPHERRILFDMPHLKVFTPSPEYLLAMKVLAARANTPDRADIEVLIEKLDLQAAEQVLEIVQHYYPHKQVKFETQT
ncbi:MAG: hypothetical protein QOF61_1702, partial [Acidobacteriota bacterium]|nr:hypothetical protein [Acidobacteriota bacterium]